MLCGDTSFGLAALGLIVCCIAYGVLTVASIPHRKKTAGSSLVASTSTMWSFRPDQYEERGVRLCRYARWVQAVGAVTLAYMAFAC